MKSSKSISALSLFILTLIMSTNLVHSAETVRVGFHESKPLSFSLKDGSINGIYPDVIREIAELSDWEIEWVKVSWIEGLQMIQNGKLDLLGPIGFTKERLKKFNFNQEAVLVDWGQIYLPDNSEIQTILDLEGTKIVFQNGHMMGNYLVELLDKFDIHCEIETVKDQKTVFEMISNGNADAGTVNRLFGILNEKDYKVQRSPIIYSPMELRFAAPKSNNSKILDQIDSQLKRLKKDKNSKYQLILDNWLFGKLSPGWHATLKQVMVIVGIGLFLIVVILVWSISLKSQVKARTKELGKSTKELEKTNFLLNAVMENTTDAIFIKNIDGEYVLANTSTCSAMGKSLDQVIGKSDAQLFPGSSAKVINDVDTRVLRDKKNYLIEEKLDTAYGETYWLANKTPYFDEEKNLLGLIGISRNITELKNAQLEKDFLQAELRQAHKMEAIGTLTGGIAHDFNNLLGIIIGNLELALDDIPNWNPSTKHLNEIKTASFRARDVVRQLLNYSRKSMQSKKPVDIKHIIEESISLLRASIPTTIEIKLNLLEKTEIIDADTTQIHQVLINLCTNAVHAMEDSGGILSIEVLKTDLDDNSKFDFGEIIQGEYVQIIVKDSGSGIDPESQKKMFDPYFTRKEIGKGTGMGLAIVQGIVLNHQGAISVQSELEKGTSIRLVFPISQQATHQKTEPLAKLSKGNEKILFIDDDDALAKLSKVMLERLGYCVEVRTDPRDAWDLFKSNPNKFDLIITDMTMPHLTGDQISKQMLKIRPDLPIILCTGFNDKISSESASEIGIRKFIEKPIGKQLFAKTIRDVLDKN